MYHYVSALFLQLALRWLCSACLQDDVRSMADNLSEIVKLCRVESETQVSTFHEDYLVRGYISHQW
jgi:hypothetical protein